MKIKIITLLFLFQLKALAGDKHALLVTIGKYEDNRLTRLSSINDGKHVKEALIYRGFFEKNIVQLENEQATKENVLNTLGHHLMFKIKKGDVVYFHFSGHGQQIVDENNDELDGYDEAILAYDARSKNDNGKYSDKGHIRDDELSVIFLKIREKLGPNGQLVVVFDSCHSGTMTRGETGVVRGVLKPFGEARSRESQVSHDSFLEKEEGIKHPLSPLISIEATSPFQLNRETLDYNRKGIGSLSFALFKGLGKKTHSFSELLQEVRIAMMHYSQTPSFEGDLKLSLFGDNSSDQHDYFKVINLKGDVATIDAGMLHDIHSGAIVSMIDRASNKLMDRCTVLHSTLTSSQIRVKRSLKDESVYRAKFFVSKMSYLFKLPISVHVESEEMRENITSLFDRLGYMQQMDCAIHKIREEKEGFYLLKNGERIKLFSPSNDGIIEALEIFLGDLYEIEFLRQLKEDNDNYKIVASLSLENNSREDGRVFKLGEEVIMEVKNVGSKGAYFNIIELYEDSI